MTTALLFHASPTMHPRYAAALPSVQLAIVLSHGSQFSAGYDERTGIASQYKTLPALLAKFAPAWQDGDPLVLIGFSAGCWALRAYLRDPKERARVTAAVFLDGLHSSGSDHAADRGPIEGVLAYATDSLAAPDQHRLLISHTQITPQGYASTRATADRVCEALGATRPSRDESKDLGAVKILAYPGADAAAHRHQLQEVGPALLKEHVTPFLASLHHGSSDLAEAAQSDGQHA